MTSGNFYQFYIFFFRKVGLGVGGRLKKLCPSPCAVPEILRAGYEKLSTGVKCDGRVCSMVNIELSIYYLTLQPSLL